MKYAYIQDHRRKYPTELLCRVLSVTRSGFYAWRHGRLRPRRLWRYRLLQEIRQSFLESRRTYGSPRIHRELVARGLTCCVNTVAKVMKSHDIRAQTRRRFRVKTTDSSHGYAVATNRLDRCFAQPGPNCAWVSDITFVPTGEGWLYLAVIVDLFSRKVVGWAMADHLKAILAVDALKMAIRQRRPAEGLVIHSDQGIQYACREYQKVLGKYKLVCSMSRPGNCYDNAVMESFFGTLKSELIRGRTYATRAEARRSIFEYIEVFYNRQRRHSTLGYRSPDAFELDRKRIVRTMVRAPT